MEVDIALGRRCSHQQHGEVECPGSEIVGADQSRWVTATGLLQTALLKRVSNAGERHLR